jgi:zinc and cadmium transporter
MMQVWLYSLVSVIIVSLISLIGVFFISLGIEKLRRILIFLVSFAVGGLFGDAFIHLLPESFEKITTITSIPLLIILGILIFFILEKFLRWRHCHVPTSETHLHPVVTMNLVGDGVHNTMDGMIIGASFLVNRTIGITTTLAVILHEIPQEIGDFGILVHGGLTPKKALTYNFLSAIFAILGTILSLIIGPYVKNYATFLLPITAGGFIYMAGSDLIPELHLEVEVLTSLLQFILILLGIGVMLFLRVLG